jgi:hypothetical protein
VPVTVVGAAASDGSPGLEPSLNTDNGIEKSPVGSAASSIERQAEHRLVAALGQRADREMDLRVVQRGGRASAERRDDEELAVDVARHGQVDRAEPKDPVGHPAERRIDDDHLVGPRRRRTLAELDALGRGGLRAERARHEQAGQRRAENSCNRHRVFRRCSADSTAEIARGAMGCQPEMCITSRTTG